MKRWLALYLPLWLVFTLCAYWEPVTRDGWGHVLWHRANDVGLASLYDFCQDSYLHLNPRIGQLYTLLAYTPGPYHVIVTPLLHLALLAMLAALALGRWPRRDDLLVTLMVVAAFAVSAPEFGAMLFYRPYTGNYTWSFLVGVLWLLSFRFHIEEPLADRWWRSPLLFVTGAIAGMGNEHTGLAYLAMGGLVALWSLRARTLRVWMFAALAGLLAGYLALLLAPGHAYRYDGLAEKAGILDRITERDLAANARIIWLLGYFLAPALPWLGLGLVARWRGKPELATRRMVCLLATGAVVATFALLASPKLGPRLYFASTALGATAIAGWSAAQLVGRFRLVAALLSACALAWVLVRLTLTYRAVAEPGARRLELIQHGAPGAHVVVPRYPIGITRYFLGDDFRAASLRETLAREYGLGSIDVER